MKISYLIGWVLLVLAWGCASVPPYSTARRGSTAIPERTVTNVAGTEKNLLILRQSRSKSAQSLDKANPKTRTKPDLQTTAAACPPGQLMATRIITGETGTRITEECLTPFSSKGRSFSRNRPVAIKVRNVDGNLVANKVTRK